jgi:hypothetical protein
MAKLSISKAWEETSDIVSRDGRLITTVALALIALPQLIVGIAAPPAAVQSGLGLLLSIVAALIALLGQMALVRLAIGPSTSVGESIAHAARRYPSAIGAFLLILCAFAVVIVPLTAVLMSTGLLQMPAEGDPPTPSFLRYIFALLILGLLIGVKFLMVTPVATTEPVGPLTIIKRSWSLTKDRYWPLLGFELLLVVTAFILLLAAQIVGGILARAIGGDVSPFTLGALIQALFVSIAQAGFTVLIAVMLARIYVQLSGKSRSRAGVPKTGD